MSSAWMYSLSVAPCPPYAYRVFEKATRTGSVVRTGPAPREYGHRTGEHVMFGSSLRDVWVTLQTRGLGTRRPGATEPSRGQRHKDHEGTKPPGSLDKGLVGLPSLLCVVVPLWPWCDRFVYCWALRTGQTGAELSPPLSTEPIAPAWFVNAANA